MILIYQKKFSFTEGLVLTYSLQPTAYRLQPFSLADTATKQK